MDITLTDLQTLYKLLYIQQEEICRLKAEIETWQTQAIEEQMNGCARVVAES
jgi:hypothetical protein